MVEKTRIEWCDHTFNPWEGCQKVGPGCDNCYAETRNARFGAGHAVNWGPGAPRRRTSISNWNKPMAWNRNHDKFYAEHGRRQRVFCASLADVFDNAVDPEWRANLFALITKTPNLDWLLLTKRIGNVPAMVSIIPGWLPENVWLGATIVNQAEADRDIAKLLAVPAHVRFLSMEPLLGPVSLRWLRAWPENAPTTAESPTGRTSHLDGLSRLDWVIVGGESGPGARPMHPDWAGSLRDQCTAAGVPFLFKQWGEWVRRDASEQRGIPDHILNDIRKNHTAAWPDGTVGYGDHRLNGGYGKPLFRVGKKAAGRLLDGCLYDEYPQFRRAL